MCDTKDDGELHFERVVVCQFVLGAFPDGVHTKRICYRRMSPLSGVLKRKRNIGSAFELFEKFEKMPCDESVSKILFQCKSIETRKKITSFP